MLWSSLVQLKLTITGTAFNVGQLPINYGVTDALSAFPLHQLASVMTCTINNNSCSLNVRDLLPTLMRFQDKRELSRYNGYAPTACDTVGDYPDALGSNLNPLGSWANSSDNDLFQRGAFNITRVSTTQTGAIALPAPIVLGVNPDIYITFRSTEPLLISPFIWGHPETNNQGFYGVQNANFVFNIGDASRVFRSANYNPFVDPAGLPATAPQIPSKVNSTITAISVQEFSDTKLIFNFLTPHPSDLMPARNVCGFYELPRFLSTPNVKVPAFGSTTAGGNRATLQTSSLQLNQIADKLIIQVRQPMGSSWATQPDCGLVITGVSISFNNQAGILASASQFDLFRYSVESGSNQSWFEFSGSSNVPDNTTGCGKRLPGSGSMLALSFAEHIQLTEDYYAPGSLKLTERKSDWKQFASPNSIMCY